MKTSLFTVSEFNNPLKAELKNFKVQQLLTQKRNHHTKVSQEPDSPNEMHQAIIEQMSSRSSLVDKNILLQQKEPAEDKNETSPDLPGANPEQFYQDLQINLFMHDTNVLSRSSQLDSCLKPSLKTESHEEQANSTAEFKLANLQPVDIKANNVEYYSSNKKMTHVSVHSNSSVNNIKAVQLKN